VHIVLDKKGKKTSQRKLVECLPRFSISGDTFLIILALFVGIGGGLFAVFFRYLISWANKFFFGIIGSFTQQGLGNYGGILIPALGGLVVGPLVYFFAKEAKGHGVPEVMNAVALGGGKIRPRVVIVKALASAVSIGSGGSVGREGPIVQMGSGIGSTIGQLFHLSEDMVKTLVGCGAAAGIAATFNAPIAGTLFALEIILGDFTATTFSLLVISSVAASVVARTLLVNVPAFIVPPYELVTPYELGLYVFLGLLASILGYLFTRGLYFTEDMFASIKKVPEYLKPIIGGLLIGIIGLQFPQIFGVGYETIEVALDGKMAAEILLMLAFMKIIATSITLGSGGSGGVFAPSLFMGATFGGAFGAIVNSLYPSLTASPGAYALVGMGAVVSATTQAPITAIVIIFEMTRDYRIILPLMIACVISTMVARALGRETIYTLKLLRRGINLKAGRDINVMRAIKVSDAMRTELDYAKDDMTIRDVVKLMQKTRHTGFPVLGSREELVGIVTLKDIRDTKPPEKRLSIPVKDIMTTDLIVSYPDDTLDDVFKKLTYHNIGRLPVVKRENPERIIGMLSRSDIINAYNQKVVELEHT